MIQNMPILMNYREKSIHFGVDALKMRRDMVPDIDRLFAIPSAELRNVGHSCVI